MTDQRDILDRLRELCDPREEMGPMLVHSSLLRDAIAAIEERDQTIANLLDEKRRAMADAVALRKTVDDFGRQLLEPRSETIERPRSRDRAYLEQCGREGRAMAQEILTDLREKLAALRATAPSGAEAMREAAAKVCEVEASKWELKIETSPEPPEAKPNLMWAHMANEASDCAELIRALPLPASPPPALGDVSAEELKAVRGDIEHRLKFFIIPERRALLESFLSRIPAAGKDAEE
jgi:hypothetical protein